VFIGEWHQGEPLRVQGLLRYESDHAAHRDDRRPGRTCRRRAVVTMDEVRALARTLPRSSEAFVRGRVKFRIGRIVWLAFSRDGETMGFAFPKEWRAALVDSDPKKFSLPSQSDLRYHWAHVRLAALDPEEMRELVEDAWAFCVPKRVVEEYLAARG
jgi:hypothetical protein